MGRIKIQNQMDDGDIEVQMKLSYASSNGCKSYDDSSSVQVQFPFSRGRLSQDREDEVSKTPHSFSTQETTNTRHMNESPKRKERNFNSGYDVDVLSKKSGMGSYHSQERDQIENNYWQSQHRYSWGNSAIGKSLSNDSDLEYAPDPINKSGEHIDNAEIGMAWSSRTDERIKKSKSDLGSHHCEERDQIENDYSQSQHRQSWGNSAIRESLSKDSDLEYAPDPSRKLDEFIDNDDIDVGERSRVDKSNTKNDRKQNSTSHQEVNIKRKKGYRRKDIEQDNVVFHRPKKSGMSKRQLFTIASYIVIAGIVCWLLRAYFRIPGLNDEINKLSKQVGHLSSEIDRMTVENNRLEGQVDRLQEINSNLEQTKNKLSEENNKTEELTLQLNSTLVEFKDQNEILRDENDRYQEYTNTLNETVQSLVVELADVGESEKRLTEAIDEYEVAAANLELEILSLTNQTGDLNDTVNELHVAVSIFEEENDKIRELNEDLGKIVGFLQVEADSVQKSYAELAEQLADTILRKEILAEVGLKERMRSELAGWECGFLTAFGNQDFSKNQEISIGYSNYDFVMSYISDRLLSDLCIVRANLEVYLRNEVIPSGSYLWDINMKDLAFGINMYASDVLDHYFPSENDINGLENVVWNIADYDCRNLDLDDRYFYAVS